MRTLPFLATLKLCALTIAALDIAAVTAASAADLNVQPRHRHHRYVEDDCCARTHYNRYRGYCNWTAERHDFYRGALDFYAPPVACGYGRYGYYAPPSYYGPGPAYAEYVPYGYYRSYAPAPLYYDVLYGW